MTTTPCHMTMAEAADALADKALSAYELTQAHIKAIGQHKDLNAFITTTAEHALKQAQASDERRKRGESLGVLDGLPLAIKDLFCTSNTRTTAASKILANWTPPYESTVTARLWQNGAVMLGKTNMDEFAMGSASNTGHFGSVINPWVDTSSPNTPLTAGGSSGGSAAAVAARLALGALGSDTGGSIRQPAALCGIVGVKPTYGRCSRYGMIAFSSSLDQAGTFTRSVKDAGLILNAICGFDKNDTTTSKQNVPDFTQAIGKNVKGLRVGIPKEYHHDNVQPSILAAWQQAQDMLKDNGAQLVPVSLPHTIYALPAYYIIAPAEASSNLARYDGIRYGLRAKANDLDELYHQTRSQGFGEEVKRRLLIGTYVLSAGYYDAYYLKATKVRAKVKEDFDHVFNKVDALLTPTTPNTAFPVHQQDSDPITMYVNDLLTVPASLAGLPSLSLPICRNERGLPLGVHLIAPSFDETTLLRVAHVLESNIEDDFTPPARTNT
ncbi:MAG: Asp-tRNA(Asn)/Glu-tRNA(Gln) amidotransferase subunit GatA [Alphaproteobacteria bacterium GM202ARS2]|nr:Asp-tRNA(Asn)/Glu-tRNA(Gln) amidotransferase subunit GatA [Alphaproteobacteria bacterium GM202ARS2]